MRALLRGEIWRTQGKYYLNFLDSEMPDSNPQQPEALPSIDDGARSSLMLVQHEDAAVHSASDQNRRGELYQLIQDR